MKRLWHSLIEFVVWIYRQINRVLVSIFIALVWVYRHTLTYLFPSSCRYTPTCSQYAMDALRKYGFLKGTYYSIKRIGRCHPYSNHNSYDPA